MSNFARIWSLMAVLMLAVPAHAQEAADAGAADSSEATGSFVTGQEVAPEGPQPGDAYVTEEVGDFKIQCLKMAEGEDPCTLYQLLRDKDGNAVAEVTIFRLPPGGQAEVGATVVVPLETLLTRQLTLSVDGGPAKRYPFAFCNRVGCYARIGLTAEDVALFKRGKAATITIYPAAAPDQPVSVTLSLTGFTRGLGKASVVNPG